MQVSLGVVEMADKNKGGRPPMFKSAKEMQKLIDEYFIACEGEKAIDNEGNPMVTKYGYLYKVEPKPPTITGLALALGFTNRVSLLNYQGKDEFVNTITRAKAKVEEYAETRLFDKDGANGAKFSLANNFHGWKDKTEVDSTVTIKGKLEDFIK
jgi:hypothetical protein